MKDLQSVQKLIENLDDLFQKTFGQEKYIIEGIKNLVESNARVENAVENFEKSTRKTEIIMLILAGASAILVIVQILIQFIL